MNTRYSFVLLTCDRSPKPNYVTDTLNSLSRSQLPDDSFLTVCANGMKSSRITHLSLFQYLGYGSDQTQTVLYRDRLLPVNEHVSAALKFAVNRAADVDSWIIFLEDDLLFCSDFFSSIRRWLGRNSTKDRRLYSFGCPYSQPIIKSLLWGTYNTYVESNVWSYYPTESFYGTQCFAVRSIDAMILSDYLSSPEYLTKFQPGNYDLGIAYILSQVYPSIGYFAASRPSFVQHVGVESSIRPDGPYFTFPSFPGEEWSYNP